jgi:endonuclease/exonuclease/phosphatase family metal-dependent hydrolase
MWSIRLLFLPPTPVIRSRGEADLVAAMEYRAVWYSFDRKQWEGTSMVAKLKVMAWNIDGAAFSGDTGLHAVENEFGAGNPSGPWSFGYSIEGGEAYAFIPFDNFVQGEGAASGLYWRRGDYFVNGTPTAWKNTSATTQNGVAPGQVSLHPGPRPEGDFAILRFTAPVEGDYKVWGRFLAGDRGVMNARIRTAGQLWDAADTSWASTDNNPAFSFIQPLGAGATLDFIVGNNGDYSFGNTPISVVVQGVDQMEKLGNIADAILGERPDIVLLNEIAIWNAGWFGGVDQVQTLAQLTQHPYSCAVSAACLGFSGRKNVAALSRYPLGPAVRHGVGPIALQAPPCGFDTKFSLLETSVVVDNRMHHLLSLRLNGASPDENMTGNRMVSDWAVAQPATDAVIVGGDFNSPKMFDPNNHDPDQSFNFSTPWYAPDLAASGLTPALPDDGAHIDHVHFRGPYMVFDVAMAGNTHDLVSTSDHGFVSAELGPLASDFIVRRGGVVKLKHFNTGHLLHSLDADYLHPGGSGRQIVNGNYGYDDDDFWVIEDPAAEDGYLQAIQDGSRVSLRHDRTRKLLYSQRGVVSPVSGQQEVSCADEADGNHVWLLEVEGGGVWDGTKRIKLVHDATDCALHSHRLAPSLFTANEQEVTCFQDRDDNDWWSVCEIRGTLLPFDASFVSQEVPVDMLVGAHAQVRMQFFNDGATTWSAAAGFRLRVDPAAAWGLPAEGVPLAADVPTGGTAEITFTVTNGQVGRQQIQARMTQPDGTPFGDPSFPSFITVAAAGENPQCGPLRGQIAAKQEQVDTQAELYADNPTIGNYNKLIALRQQLAQLQATARNLGCTI